MAMVSPPLRIEGSAAAADGRLRSCVMSTRCNTHNLRRREKMKTGKLLLAHLRRRTRSAAVLWVVPTPARLNEALKELKQAKLSNLRALAALEKHRHLQAQPEARQLVETISSSVAHSSQCKCICRRFSCVLCLSR